MLAPLSQGDVEQQALSIGCEVDSQGYQTGRCLWINFCADSGYSCQVGVRYGVAIYDACGTLVNTVRCNVLGIGAQDPVLSSVPVQDSAASGQ